MSIFSHLQNTKLKVTNKKRPQILTKQNQNVTSVTTRILETYILMQILGIRMFILKKYMTYQSSKYRLGSRLQQYKNKIQISPDAFKQRLLITMVLKG